MNAGLSNLKFLKAQLLAEALRVTTKYDAPILAIGTGVAAQFEKSCNRKFLRTENATFTCSADRDHVFLDRYPLESVSLVELRTSATTGWETQTNFIQNLDERTGKVFWGYAAAPHYGQLRFTFTGGFWWDTTEEGDDTLPTGATALDADLQLAWILQCRLAWQAIDKIGQDIIKTGSSSNLVSGTLAGLEMLPDVKEKLRTFRRMQLT
jgi:hypothetical protein